MLIKSKILLLIVFLVNGLVFNRTSHSIYIIDLIGTWEGENNSFSSEKGYRTWDKKIKIFEQNKRIFKGNFKYADGEKNFFGVIRANNKNFYWVSPESKGYIHGEVLNINTMEVCYTEAFEGAAVGCAILKRKK